VNLFPLRLGKDFAIIRKVQMVHQGSIQLEGVVLEALPSTMFRVQLSDEAVVLCTLSGKMRIHYVKILPGDRVQLEVSPHDKTRGRITRRL
jgi:translation initiation factor IF-1